MSSMLAVFVVVFGFVTAGFVATASAIYQNSDGSIQFSMNTPVQAITGFVICMFVGPYVIAKNSLFLWAEEKLSFSLLGLCLLVSLAWSFCIGIVSIQTLVGLGLA